MKNVQNADFPPFKTCFFIIILFLLISVNITTPPAPTVTAASDAVRWTKVNIPTEGEAGGWVLAAGSDIQQLIIADESTLYAHVEGLTHTLYRSTDGGYSWEYIGNVQDDITGMATSPHNTSALYYATTSEVYRSTDGGRTFAALPPNPGGAGTANIEITTIDVVYPNSNIIVIGIRDNDSAEFGGVYTLNEADIIPEWEDTNIGNYDVCTVAHSPDYSAGQQSVAVVTDENDTYITTKIGNTGWNAEIGYARLDILATSAEIAFPSINGIAFIPEDLVCFVAIDTGTGEGDVYRINGNPAPGTSIATDLNAGSAYSKSNIDISGLAAYNDNANITLLAGAAESAVTYVSTDAGETWTKSRKAPTGGSQTGVLIAPDSGDGGGMYAFTSGENSALSISRDIGETWNQLSFIDSALNSIVDLAPSPRYNQDRTLFMLTFGSGPYSEGLWRSLNGGDTWERTLSGYPDAVDSLRKVALPPEYGDGCQTVFVAGDSSGKTVIWESTDNGQSYRRRFPRDPASGETLPIDTWVVADKKTLFIGSYDGSQAQVYKTVNGGSSFTEGIPAGKQPLQSIALSPHYVKDGIILAGNTNGWVYRADGNRTSFKPLPGDAVSPPFSGLVTVAFDADFSKNNTAYATSDGADSRLYRFVIGTSAEWESIDATLPTGAMLNRLTVASDGALYAVNSKAGGGMERSINPTFASRPTFETMTRGLSSSATLYGLWQADHRVWSADTTNARLMTFEDTLTATPVLLSPDEGASAIGALIDHTVRNISLDWETMDGATGYEWECGYDDDFSSASGKFTDSTSASYAHLPALEPATTYHWRVRAGSPVLSPWSEKKSFTTVMDTEVVTLKSESPAAGATGVPVKPVFQWTAIIGAQAYELLVATDANISHQVIVRTDENALAGNVWQCDISLDYGTTYYWKVRATSAITRSAWSTTGVFTTEAAPASLEPDEDTRTSVLNHEETTLPKNPDPAIPPAVNPALVNLEPPPTPMPTTDGIILPNLSELSSMPNWVFYLIGGLLATIIFALIVILAIILKTKRVK